MTFNSDTGKHVPSLYKDVFPQVKKLKALKHRVRAGQQRVEEGVEDEGSQEGGSQEGGSQVDGSQEGGSQEGGSQEDGSQEDGSRVESLEGSQVDSQEDNQGRGNEDDGDGNARDAGVVNVGNEIVLEEKPRHWIVKMFCGKALGIKREYEPDHTEWSDLISYDIEMDTSGAEEVKDGGDRGQLVVRLIKSIRGNVVKGLDEGVRHMTLGERSLIKVRYDHAYSSFSMGANIPPRSDLVFKVELLKINGWGAFGMPYRQLKRFMRMIGRMLVRFNVLWSVIKAFERRTRFFERIAVLLRIKSKLSDIVEDEELGQDYDDDDVDYAELNEDISDEDLEVDSQDDVDHDDGDDTHDNADDDDDDDIHADGGGSLVDSLVDPLVSIGDSVHDNLARKLRPERVLKTDSSVIVGANILWTHKPRVVLSKRRKKRLTDAEKQAQREERRQIREQRREARLRKKQEREANEGDDGDDGDDGEEQQDDDEDGSVANKEDDDEQDGGGSVESANS